MKAISLWQPWASAVVEGLKFYDTRSWRTKFRGRIAIHASQKIFSQEEMIFTAGLWCPVFDREERVDLDWLYGLPRGAIIGTVEIVNIVPTEQAIELAKNRRHVNALHQFEWSEFDLGNYAPGRWVWVLKNPEPIKPIPFRARRMLFEVDDATIARAKA